MMAKSEGDIKAEILIALGRQPDVMVWNHPTGNLPVEGGGRVSFGCKGSPDIVGAAAYTIKPEDVGKTVGLFLGVEVKRPGENLGSDQEIFHRAMRVRARGTCVVARSADDAMQSLETLRVNPWASE